MNWKRLVILVQFDLRHSVFRLKGLVFLIPFFCFWYWIFRIFIKEGTDFLVSQESFVITYFFLRNTEIVQSLLINNPPTLSVFLVLSITMMPFFVMLAGNNQLASDAGAQTFRYLLTRCTRMEIFFSRFISAYLLMVSTIILAAVIATIISLQYDKYSITETLYYAQQVLLFTLIYAIPFFAYMSFVSALMSSALGTLLMSIVIYIILMLLGYYLPIEFSLLPSGLKENLYIFNTSNLAYVLTGIMTYTLIYTGIGWMIFRKRNL